MNAVTARATPKHRACEIISYYLKHHDSVRLSFEKTCYYEWAVKEALTLIKRSCDPPMTVLDNLLIKYDEWAHTDSNSAEAFKIAASAIEDIIDLLVTS